MIQSINNAEWLSVLLEGLAQRGVRLTGQRRRVVQAIASQQGLFSAEGVHRQVPEVGRATVFRTLKVLVDTGLVCRVVMEGGAPRYWVASRPHHHHLVCISCGQVKDFVRLEVESFVQHIALPSDFQVVGHRLEVYGLCFPCQQKGAQCSS